MRFLPTRHGTALLALVTLLAPACGGDDGDAEPDAGPNGNGSGNGEPDAQLEGIERASYQYEVEIPGQENGEPTCCRNFGEISEEPDEIDNAVAGIAQGLSSFIDVQAEIDEQIEEGELALILNHVEVASENDNFALEALQAEFAGDTDYEDASAGEGEFAIDPVSYGDDGDAQVVFEDAWLDGGELGTDPTEITISAPVGDDQLGLVVQETQVSGQASLTETGIEYEGGELSGYVVLEDFFEEANTLLQSEECACLDLDEGDDVFFRDDGEWEADCVEEHECEDGGLCESLGGDNFICSSIPSLLESNADLDTNDDGDTDALSLGLEWRGTTADIVE